MDKINQRPTAVFAQDQRCTNHGVFVASFGAAQGETHKWWHGAEFLHQKGIVYEMTSNALTFVSNGTRLLFSSCVTGYLSSTWAWVVLNHERRTYFLNVWMTEFEKSTVLSPACLVYNIGVVTGVSEQEIATSCAKGVWLHSISCSWLNEDLLPVCVDSNTVQSASPHKCANRLA